MTSKKLTMLVETSRRLLRRGAIHNIQKIIAKAHSADVAGLLQNLGARERQTVFALIGDNASRASVLSEMEPGQRADFLVSFELEELCPILKEMSSDDLADLLGELPEEFSTRILAMLGVKDSEEVEGLMRYPKDSAGGLMVPEFFALSEHMTAEEAVAKLREAGDVEMAFYVYVTNEHGHLVGVVSLRQLVIVPPRTLLHDIMQDNVVSVKPEVHQEEVARLVAKYNFLAIPVVDESHKLLGLVTVDDVLDVVREEATADLLRMAGTGEDRIEVRPVLESALARLPWLLASLAGGVLAMLVMRPFVEYLHGFIYLALFVPALLGLGGTMGNQSASIIVNVLSAEGIEPRQFRGLLLREAGVGTLFGLGCGVLVGLFAWVFTSPDYAIVVGVSLWAGMFVAVAVGSLLPLLFARLHIDPTFATVPFVSASLDVLGVLVYLGVAALVVGHGAGA